MERLVYKTVDGHELALHVFKPEGHSDGACAPSIVFFFGGGWQAGTHEQFFPQCRYLALRGMVAISAEYRVKQRHGSDPFLSVADGRSAMRYVRAHAAELGVDPARIAAGGGSAGGHVAACTTVLDGPDDPADDVSVRCGADALVLFNPVVDLTDNPDLTAPWDFDVVTLSPVHHVKPDLPPCLIMQGTEDKAVSIGSVKRFVRAYGDAGNRYTLAEYDGAVHGFFNNEPFYSKTEEVMGRFLDELDWIHVPGRSDAQRPGV